MLTQVSPRALFKNGLIVLLFGIVVPGIKGLEFLDVLILLPYSFLGLFFVAPHTIDAAFERPGRRVSRPALFRAISIGWGMGLGILILGIGAVSWRAGRPVTPPVPISLSLAVLSLFGCLFMAAISAWLASRSTSAGAAKSRVRIISLLILVILLALPRVLPDDAASQLLLLLTPEGLVTATLIAAPVSAAASVFLLRRAALH
jgi:hypothetical protein